jgi:hypothetical protein
MTNGLQDEVTIIDSSPVLTITNHRMAEIVKTHFEPHEFHNRKGKRLKLKKKKK